MTIEANELRRLAEAADGLRNQDLVLVKRGDVHMVVAASDVVGTDMRLIELRTNDDATATPRPAFGIELTISGGPSTGLESRNDSLFWSLSAVDKFVIPYYTRLWPTEKVLAFREKLASDAEWVALEHPPGSSPEVLMFSGGALKNLSVDEYLEEDDDDEDEEEENRQQQKEP